MEEKLRLKTMTRLNLTHEGWYRLPQWERDTFLAYTIYREKQIQKYIDNLSKWKRENKLVADAVAPIYNLMLELV